MVTVIIVICVSNHCFVILYPFYFSFMLSFHAPHFLTRLSQFSAFNSPIHPSVYLSVSPPVRLSIHPSICLYIRPSDLHSFH